MPTGSSWLGIGKTQDYQAAVEKAEAALHPQVRPFFVIDPNSREVLQRLNRGDLLCLLHGFVSFYCQQFSVEDPTLRLEASLSVFTRLFGETAASAMIVALQIAMRDEADSVWLPLGEDAAKHFEEDGSQLITAFLGTEQVLTEIKEPIYLEAAARQYYEQVARLRSTIEEILRLGGLIPAADYDGEMTAFTYFVGWVVIQNSCLEDMTAERFCDALVHQFAAESVPSSRYSSANERIDAGKQEMVRLQARVEAYRESLPNPSCVEVDNDATSFEAPVCILVDKFLQVIGCKHQFTERLPIEVELAKRIEHTTTHLLDALVTLNIRYRFL